MRIIACGRLGLGGKFEVMNLKTKFLRLFSIFLDKESFLWQGGELNENLEWVWKIDWRRNMFEWEKNQEQDLLQLLGEKSVNMDNEDTWVWKDGETMVFTIKSAYKILKEDVQGEKGELYVSFWKIKAQPSALVTAWRVLEDKISTRENLVRRGIRKDSCICFLCGEEEETTSHLFCTCRVA